MGLTWYVCSEQAWHSQTALHSLHSSESTVIASRAGDILQQTPSSRDHTAQVSSEPCLRRQRSF